MTEEERCNCSEDCHCDKDDCDCEQEDSEEEEEEDTAHDLAEGADDKVDSLINLLVKKGVITHQEFDAEYDDLFEEDDGEAGQ